MIGIYKITNKINGLSYIGQSVHIERRFIEHCLPSKTSKISYAIQEYGKNNFDFSVLEECSQEQLNDREVYWIQYFNTIVPYGYNVAETNSATNHTVYYHYNKEQLQSILKDLYNSQYTLKDIANKYNLNISTISRINKGLIHWQPNIQYPIKNTNRKILSKKYCIDCGIEISYTATRCNKCAAKQRIIEKPISREQLKKLIRNVPFTTIGKQFNVTDNAIRKWCKSYNLPTTKKEIKQYTEKEWEQI